jgi:hypothetical protein
VKEAESRPRDHSPSRSPKPPVRRSRTRHGHARLCTLLPRLPLRQAGLHRVDPLFINACALACGHRGEERLPLPSMRPRHRAKGMVVVSPNATAPPPCLPSFLCSLSHVCLSGRRVTAIVLVTAMAVTSACARACPHAHPCARAPAHTRTLSERPKSSLWLCPLALNLAVPLAAPLWPLPRGLS